MSSNSPSNLKNYWRHSRDKKVKNSSQRQSARISSPSPTRAEPSTSPPPSPTQFSPTKHRSSLYNKARGNREAHNEKAQLRTSTFDCDIPSPTPVETRRSRSTRTTSSSIPDSPKKNSLRNTIFGRKKPDDIEHPLNLSPAEYHRLSEISERKRRSRMTDHMDVDTSTSAPASPAAASPQTNGTTHANGIDNPPTPPAHKVPVAPTQEEAEAFKTAGNKYFKAKEYGNAIDEYTKGMMCCT